jgi:hypothetical protein
MAGSLAQVQGPIQPRSLPASVTRRLLPLGMGILRPQKQQRGNRAFHAQVINILYTGVDAVLADVATLQKYGTGGGGRAGSY